MASIETKGNLIKVYEGVLYNIYIGRSYIYSNYKKHYKFKKCTKYSNFILQSCVDKSFTPPLLTIFFENGWSLYKINQSILDLSTTFLVSSRDNSNNTSFEELVNKIKTDYDIYVKERVKIYVLPL